MFGDRMTQLHGSQVVLQLMSEADVDAITEILADPQVAMWWGQWDRERVKEEFTDSDLGVYVIRPLIDGEPGPVIGSAQYFEELSPDFKHAGMDVFLDGRYRGKGYGADVIRTLCRHLFYDRGHHRIVVDPDARNEKAIAAWKSVGFRQVGLMRMSQRGPDEQWHDSVMLEALKDEVV